MIPISAVLTSASVHDSQVAIPLATISSQRITHCYDLMDAAYCSPMIRAHSERLGHVPLIDHNPRGGAKIHFAPHQAQRFKERSTVERVNARLKDHFGVCRVNVCGHAKVLAQMMFAVLALSADQLLRWRTQTASPTSNPTLRAPPRKLCRACTSESWTRPDRDGCQNRPHRIGLVRNSIGSRNRRDTSPESGREFCKSLNSQ